MTRKTNTRNTYKPQSMLAKLVKLADASDKANGEVQSILDEANARIDATRAPVLAAFKSMGEALSEAHPDGLTQAIFDDAYKAGLMAHFVERLAGKGAEEKAAKMQAGVQYNHMRAALLGFAEGIEVPEGVNSFQVYGKHVKATAPDMFEQSGAKRGRKTGSRKATDAKPAIDVTELSGKRGALKDVAQEIIDLLRIAKAENRLEEVRDVLADLLAE